MDAQALLSRVQDAYNNLDAYALIFQAMDTYQAADSDTLWHGVKQCTGALAPVAARVAETPLWITGVVVLAVVVSGIMLGWVTLYFIAPRPRAPLLAEFTFAAISVYGMVVGPLPLPCWANDFSFVKESAVTGPGKAIKGGETDGDERATDAEKRAGPIIPRVRMEKPELFMSVVVPAFNEEKRLGAMLEETVEFLEREYGNGNGRRRKAAETVDGAASSATKDDSDSGLRRRHVAPAGEGNTKEEDDDEYLNGWEILIVSDGSTDNTVGTALSFARSHQLTPAQAKELGVESEETKSRAQPTAKKADLSAKESNKPQTKDPAKLTGQMGKLKKSSHARSFTRTVNTAPMMSSHDGPLTNTSGPLTNPVIASILNEADEKSNEGSSKDAAPPAPVAAAAPAPVPAPISTPPPAPALAPAPAAASTDTPTIASGTIAGKTYIPPGSIRVVSLVHNRGKGGAVAHGLRHVRGRYVVFADADGATDFSALAKLVEEGDALRKRDGQGRAVVVGSRAHLVGSEAVVKRSKLRNFLMHAFHVSLRVLTPPQTAMIRDTQCGFKLLSRTALPYIVPFMHSEGWIFDVELLMLAEFAGIAVTEVPVGWHEVSGSKLNVLRDSFGMAYGLAVLRAAWATGVYRATY